jgi:anti-anti-sigma regulatory factor
MALQHETIQLEGAVVLRLCGALEDDALGDFDLHLRAARALRPRVLILGTAKVQPLASAALGRVVACSKQMKLGGGKVVIVLPKWLGGRAALVEQTMLRQGVDVAASEAEALQKEGILYDASLLAPKTEAAEGATEAVMEEGESESYVSDLQEGINFWLEAISKKESKDALDDEVLEQVAGGLPDQGGGKGLLGELKQGIKYWIGKR